MLRFVGLVATSALVGCGGDAKCDSASDCVDTATGAGGTTGGGGVGGTTGGGAGFTVAGRAALIVDPATNAPAGLCVDILDPTPALAGGLPEVLGSTTVGADGSFSVSGLVTTSSVGLLMAVADCADATVPSGGLATATGIEAVDYTGVADGTVLSGYTAFFVDGATTAAWTAGLGAAGFTGDLAAGGSLLGFVLDPMGVGVDGAVVSGPPDVDIYYAAANGFGTTGTLGAAGGLFLIPGAPIFTYGCSGGGYEYDSILAGSQPGFQVVVAFNGK